MAASVRFDPSAPYEIDESDVPFARPGGVELLARVYRPRGEPAAPLAALVDVHGGAWSRNDRLSGAVHGRALAASGLVVVSLDFPRVPSTSIRRPAPTWRPACATCAPTRSVSASIPGGSGSWAARAAGSWRSCRR